MQRHIDNGLGQLSDRQRCVALRRFGLDGMDVATLEELGHALGVTRERARRIQIEALRRLHLMPGRSGFSSDEIFEEP